MMDPITKLITILLLLTAFSGCTGQAVDNETPNNALISLDTLEWERRIILLNTDKMTRLPYTKAMEEAKADIDERHITWFQYNNGVLITNHPGPVADSVKDEIKAYFTTGSHRVVLIGKDGGVKNRARDLDLPALFAQIDSMPMRMQEMREQNR